MKPKAIIDYDLDPQFTDSILDKLIAERSTNFYIADIFPRKLGHLWYDMEKFFLKNYHQEYAHKVIRIIFKIMGYYPAQVMLAGEHHNCFHKQTRKPFPYKVEEFIPLQSLADLAEMIKFVVTHKRSIGDILIILGTKEDDNHASIRISNELFPLSFSNITPQQVELFTILLKQENLFLIQNKNYYPSIADWYKKYPTTTE